MDDDGGGAGADDDNDRHHLQVLAVFPDTTSFYRGTISKQPVRKGGLVSEVSYNTIALARAFRVPYLSH